MGTGAIRRQYLNAEGEVIGSIPHKDGQDIRFTFSNPDVPAGTKGDALYEGGEVFDFKPSECNAEVLHCAALGGFNTALGNAGNTNVEEKSGLTDFEAMEARAERLIDGHWSKGGGIGGPKTSDLVHAMAALKLAKGVDAAEVDEFKKTQAKAFSDMDDDTYKATLAAYKAAPYWPALNHEMQTIRAERAMARAEASGKKVSSDEVELDF